MATTASTEPLAPSSGNEPSVALDRAAGFGRYMKRNPSIIAGFVMLGIIVLFWAFGTIMTAPEDAKDLAFAPPNKKPSLQNPHPCYTSENPRELCFAYDNEERQHLLGTDRLGKDILASFSQGIPQTVMIGLIAGSVGTIVGTLLAFAAGYYGGILDAAIRFIVDTLQTIPGILILIIITIAWRDVGGGEMTFIQLALIIAMLAWLGPTRVVRSQVLVMKQRFVRRNGEIVGNERTRSDPQRDGAESHAVHRGELRAGGFISDIGIHRARSTRTRRLQLQHLGNDDLSQHLVRIVGERLVVVVVTADRGDRYLVHRIVHAVARNGRVGESRLRRRF